MTDHRLDVGGRDPELEKLRERIPSELREIGVSSPGLARALEDMREESERDRHLLARANAQRLNRINASYRGLARKLIAGGVATASVVIALAVWGLLLQAQANTSAARSEAAVQAVQSGRADALKVTCAVESAVAKAGRAVIANPVPPPAAEEAALEHLGFPPFRQRLAAEERAADAYVESIAVGIDAQVGSKGDGLVKPGGTIDCAKLAALARVR